MSSYDNVVGGKLKLKGKALDVKAAGMKKKKKNKKPYDQVSQVTLTDLPSDERVEISTMDPRKEDADSSEKLSEDGKVGQCDDDQLTPAERRYIEQRQQLDVHKMAKTSNKSHRDRIQDFNLYLANMSEHYDIPKVGPG